MLSPLLKSLWGLFTLSSKCVLHTNVEAAPAFPNAFFVPITLQKTVPKAFLCSLA